MQPKITPFLWMDGKAAEAAHFYTSIFSDSQIISPNELVEPVQSVTIQLQGQTLILFNGGPMFKFNPSVSLFVNCQDQAEVDYYWDSLVAGGKASRCGWLEDRFGLSWQVIPRILGQLLADPEPARAKRALEAMLGMVKLDIAALQAAADDQ